MFLVNQFYTAKNDIVFKAVMVRNERVLRRLLEVILEIDIDEIILLDKEILPSRLMGKNRIVDLLVKSGNKMINVELNASKKYYHNYRNASYLFGIYNDAIDRSEEYETLAEKEFIGINLSYEMGKKALMEEVFYLQSKDRNRFIENFKIIEFNVDKIEKNWYTLSELEKERYKYIMMLDLEEEKLSEFCRGDEVMEEFRKEVKRINKDERYSFFLSEEEDAEKLRKTEELIRKRKEEKREQRREQRRILQEQKIEELEKQKNEMQKQNDEIQKQNDEMQKQLNNSVKKLIELNVDVNDISKTLDIPVSKVEYIAKNTRTN